MLKERNKAVLAVYAIFQNENDVLLMLRKNSGYYDNWYSLPAGHVELGELPLNALTREIREEIGVAIDLATVKLAHTMYRPKHDNTGERIDLFFTIGEWSGEFVNAEPHKCAEIKWFHRSKLPENMMHHVKRALEDIDRGNPYSQIPVTEIPPNPSAPSV